LKTIYLALGSNLGDRAANLAEARQRIGAAGVRITRESSIYETAPREIADQPWFLNQVLECETDLLPRVLLSKLQKIEREMGRKRTVAKGPRVIDLDILLIGASVIHTENLTVPHARMIERRFVLEPLAEIAPELRHPVTNRSVREMLAGVADQSVRKSSDRQ